MPSTDTSGASLPTHYNELINIIYCVKISLRQTVEVGCVDVEPDDRAQRTKFNDTPVQRTLSGHIMQIIPHQHTNRRKDYVSVTPSRCTTRH